MKEACGLFGDPARREETRPGLLDLLESEIPVDDRVDALIRSYGDALFERGRLQPEKSKPTYSRPSAFM
ncbi:hypothetical protein Apa02nite_032540 [Actinoplanes palleronii]|uniref:Uncharacterized protein n=1 Tax=Actinoplanes palleronii TaxID=113570 RepID=A0ABQ4B912_9ACTN|nr:hypothetical protein Apa02nite_032540 [Actinoplanes palleronii]